MKEEKIGFFPLVGDLLHAGHLLALKEAKENCDHLIAALNVNPDNKKPTESVYERFVRLQACKYVDEVLVYAGENDLLNVCRTLKYNVRFIGSDYKGGWPGKNIEEERGISHYIITRVPDWSSSDLKKRIINNKED